MADYIQYLRTSNSSPGEGAAAVEVTNNNQHVNLGTQLASERNPGTANQYGASNPESEYALVTADTDVSTSAPAVLYGVTVIVATATDVIEIRNSTSAGAGDVVLSIPASAAIGTYYECNGIMMDTGLYADFTGTGTLRIDWRLQ